MKSRFLAAVVVAAVLSACGGEGGSAPDGSEKIDTPNGPVYINLETKMVTGSCAAVRPYVAEHGKPGGFACT